MFTSRRPGLKTVGIALATIGTAAAAPGGAPSPKTVMPSGARTLEALTRQPAALPRRRNFKTAPMTLDHRDLWDAAVPRRWMPSSRLPLRVRHSWAGAAGAVR